MTSEEAKQKVNSCEKEIKNAYNDLWNIAKEVGSTGYEGALVEKEQIEDDAKFSVTNKIILALFISVCGVIICANSNPLGVLLIIVGAEVAYRVYKKYSKEANSRISEANAALSKVSSKQSQLNSVLDNNESI